MSVAAARAAEILSQLAVPERLAAYAELSKRGQEGATLAELSYALDRPVQDVGTTLARLVGIGVATGTGNGVYRVKPGELREVATAVDRAQPIAALLAGYPALRGFFSHGRLTSLPPTQSERYPLVGELLTRFLALTDLVDEETLNRRLAVVADDVAAVRRMLVETGWLERDRAGTTYGPVAERPLTGGTPLAGGTPLSGVTPLAAGTPLGGGTPPSGDTSLCGDTSLGGDAS